MVAEPQAVGELSGLVGQDVQYGGETVIEASFSVFELLGDLLGELLS